MNPLQQLKENIQQAFQGNEKNIDLVLVTLIAGGHLLIEDVPGVGKTTLAKSIASSISGKFSRIQFTPDLLPSDILGVSVYSPQSQNFIFKEGPIFANIVLADELNRTSPRTQASLLEAMNEGQVTIDGHTYPLPQPFMVLATQNPIGFDGTYHLPESQLDRFFMKIHLGYPTPAEEKKILKSTQLDGTLLLKPVFTLEEIERIRKEANSVHVSEEMLDYLTGLSQATRESPEILGISPRGSLTLRRAAQGLAYLRNRNYCIPDDVKEVFFPVFQHRILFRSRGRFSPKDFLQKILDRIPVPR